LLVEKRRKRGKERVKVFDKKRKRKGKEDEKKRLIKITNSSSSFPKISV
jgi:hypothetical protein